LRPQPVRKIGIEAVGEPFDLHVLQGKMEHVSVASGDRSCRSQPAEAGAAGIGVGDKRPRQDDESRSHAFLRLDNDGDGCGNRGKIKGMSAEIAPRNCEAKEMASARRALAPGPS